MNANLAPASRAQQRVWLLERIAPNNTAHHIAAAVELRGVFDVEALRQALAETAARHEPLRTTFATQDGHVVQLIHDVLPVEIAVELAESLASLARTSDDSFDVRLRAEANAPFDLVRGPLWRARLLTLGVEEAVLILTWHHIIADGWSLGVFVREVLEHYAAYREQRAPQLPELKVAYADFADWQEKEQATPAATARLAWWRERLAGVDLVDLPMDFPRPEAFSFHGATMRQEIPRATVSSVTALARQTKATPFMVLLAAWQCFFHRLTGAADFAVGTPVAGRLRPEFEPLIGLFVNTLAVRVRIGAGETFFERLAAVRSECLEVWARQDVPFESVVEVIGGARDRSRAPVFSTMLVLQNAPLPALRLVGLEAKVRPIFADGAKFDLTVMVEENAGGWGVSYEYCTDLFRAETVARWADEFAVFLAEAAARPMETVVGGAVQNLSLSVASGSIRRSEDKVRFLDPTTTNEKILAGVWREVIGVARCGVGDNFFELGGDSILALQVVVKAGRAGLKLRAADVFEHQTLGALAVAARKVNGAETEVATTEFGVDRLPVEVRARLKLAVGSLVDAWPAGPMQAGMLFQHVLVPESPAYCEQVVVTLRGALDATAFCEAWKSVLARHTNLRAVFAWEGLEEPWQAIPENIVVECLVLDWRGEESGPRLESWLAEDRARGFDLERGPLMRHALVRVAADGWLWIWTHHHILLDGWSLPVIFGELRALLSGLAIEALPMPRPYRDYLAWVRAQPRATAENYWRAMLRDWDEPTALPLVRSQAEARAQVGGDRDGMMLELSETETDALVQTARREQVTLNTLVQAAWARLLDAHAGGRGDVVFGVTVSGRPDELVDAAEMAGLFINTLPLRVQFDERALFGEWLRGLQRRQAELTRWAHCRLVDVRSWSVLAPEAPLFQTLLVFENYPSDARVLEPLGALRVEAFRFIERTELPLCVGVIPGQRLRFEFGYDPSLWRRDQMETLAARLRELLAGMVEAGGRRVADWWTSISPEGMAVTYPVFSDAEPGDATAVELLPARFARQVLERPKAVALTGAVGNWSYAELDAAADRIAIKLRDHGVGAEMVVALCLPRSAELIAAMLGVWKVGGAWLPLDPKQPVTRLAAMAADAGVRVIVAKQPLDWIDASMTCVVVEARREKSESRTLYPDGEYGVARYDSVPELRAASLAYVIFTSGSTGRPKGVAVTQGGAAHLVRGKLALVPLGPGDRALQFANPVFDACITEIFVPLCAGATVVVPPAAGLLPGAELTDFMRVHDVTFAVLTASVLAATEAGPWPRRVLFAAGEACGPEIVSAWRAPGRTIWNAYGPTEISVCATMHCDDGTAEFPIGRALPGTTVHVLDARLRPVPAGAAGEIFVGGGGVARGYLGRADLTAERFVPDPFSTTLGSRLYRTGDLGRRRADGGLDYLGRADQQVKLRGFRIETGEIESALREQPSVRDACVVVREDERGRRQLVAYLVSGDIDAAALRAVLAKRLPDYMLPAAFVVLERIPLTASGKVNRAALPALEIAEVDATADDLATPVERVLAEVWQRVLRRGAVKRQDNFFALGGDSILSLQLVGEARRRGIVFTARQLFEQPTIARLAPVCVAAAGGAAARLAAGEKFGLTPIQRWFFSLELADTHHWNQALVFTVKVRRPVLVWQTALKTLQTAHPALRLRFTRGADGEWSQHYAAEDTAMRFEVCDGASLDEAAARSLVVTRAGELQTSFDLARGPVWGAVLFDFGPTRPGKLVVAVHHLAIDGVSWRILVDDLGLVLDDDESRVASEVVTFDAWGPALELWVNSGSAQREMAYWREMVSASVQTLPLDFPSAGGNQNLGATVEVVRTGFGAAETEALLRGTPRALGASVEELLLTALARTVTTWAGGAVLAHLEGHGREEFEGAPDVSRTVGWFTALYPAVLTDARGQEASETLRDVKAARRALPQRGLGYGVLRWFGDAAARNALVPRVAPEMTFNYLGQAGASAEDAPLVLTNDDAGPTQSPRARRSHLLDVTAIVMEGQLRVDWIFSGAHHRRTTIEGLAANFFTELREVLALTDAPRDVAPQAEDFPGLNLGERELAAVWEELKNDDDR